MKFLPKLFIHDRITIFARGCCTGLDFELNTQPPVLPVSVFDVLLRSALVQE